jgi:hypothetical protein
LRAGGSFVVQAPTGERIRSNVPPIGMAPDAKGGDLKGSPAPAWSSRLARSLHLTSMLYRVLGPHERGRFAPEAWGHLLALSGAGVLSGAELEHVIERALTHIDGRIALDDLRSLIDSCGGGDALSASGGITVH